MSKRINYGGFVIGGVGFFLTRFTVTLALYENAVQFYLAGVVPLALGLGLAAFGVALAVADVDQAMVRTTAIWCGIGAATMLILVILTLVGSSSDGSVGVTTVRSQTYLSNFLIGGSVGGTLTGLYAARNQRQRTKLREQANRLVTLNRLLRDKVLNSVAAIRGYTNVDPSGNGEPMTVIDNQAADIQQTIEEVKYLTEQTGGGNSLTSREVTADLQESIARVTDRYPDTQVSVGSFPETLSVYANERLSFVLRHLLENAILHGNDESPTVEVDTAPTSVSISIKDNGPGLPDTQQSLLESGTIAEFDNPRVGFGLNVVRLLVTSYGGSIDTVVNGQGTTVTVTLSRVPTDETDFGPSRADLASIRPAAPHLVVASLAALVAGVPYGIVSELLGGSVAGIGIFYGTVDPVIGWLTHEFHSIVFGFMYVGVLSFALERYQNNIWIYVAIGIIWSIVVWIIAASFIAPVWLQLLGTSAPVPNFSLRLLANHLVWGSSLGLLTALGYTYVIPWLVEVRQR